LQLIGGGEAGEGGTFDAGAVEGVPGEDERGQAVGKQGTLGVGDQGQSVAPAVDVVGFDDAGFG